MTAARRWGTSAAPGRQTPAWWPTRTPTMPTAASAWRSPAAPCVKTSVRCCSGSRTTSSTWVRTCAHHWPSYEYPPLRVQEVWVDELETDCDRFNDELEKLSSFILPGGTPGSAYLHVARTVTPVSYTHLT